MNYCILTNNPLAEKKYGETHNVIFVNGGFKDVIMEARNMVSQGAVLLTHPLYGSVKPNETPYRSILIQPDRKQYAEQAPQIDFESERLISNAVAAIKKFSVKKEVTDPGLLEDFQVVDLSLLSSAVASADQ